MPAQPLRVLISFQGSDHCFLVVYIEQTMSDTEKPDADFAGLQVAAFESRRAEDLSRLISKHGGIPFVSPAMQEVLEEDNRPSIDLANHIMTGEVDAMVFMTGVGVHFLMSTVKRHVEMPRFLNSLEDMTTIARGPKAIAALKEYGIRPTIQVPAPNTWRELLAVLDVQLPLNQVNIAIQEYGKSNPSLIAGLEARGAHVLPIRVYRWELPTDIRPLQDNLQAIVDGQRDVLLFTSAHQLTNLLSLAEQQDLSEALRNQMGHCVVGSIGPTTSEWLRRHEFPVDLEPEHPKMGHLVAYAARHSKDTYQRKQRILHMLSGPQSEVFDTHAPWYDSPFLKACRGEPTEVTPVWLMRQAGRYMQEYREIRNKTTFLELCKSPDLCAEIMVTAVNRLGVDAAIIFSDLLPILEPMGLELEFAKGEGPVIHNPIREVEDIDRLLELDSVDSLGFVMDTVKQTRQDLPADMPLIGFSGAPFTLASYAIEGGSSRNYLNTKTIMYRDSGAWNEMMGRFVRAITRYLNAQIAAGVQCVQLFDSWAGCLGTDDYRQFVLPHVQEIIAGLTPGVPVINFATGNPALLPLLAAGGNCVVGVDWRVRLDDAWDRIGHDRSVQGNLDPLVLLADVPTIRQRAEQVLQQAGGRPGHIFNLGHGVLQQTPVDNAIALVDAVHELSCR